MVKCRKWRRLSKGCLDFYSLDMPKTVPYGTVFFRHDPDKIIANRIRIDPMFFSIKGGGTKEGTSFWSSKGIEWMSIEFISSIFHFDKYRPFSILCDNIYFSAFQLIVSLKYRITRLDEVPTCDTFSCSTDTSLWILGFVLSHKRNEQS